MFPQSKNHPQRKQLFRLWLQKDITAGLFNVDYNQTQNWIGDRDCDATVVGLLNKEGCRALYYKVFYHTVGSLVY